MSPGSVSDPVPPGTKPLAALRTMTREDITFVTTEHRAHFPENVMGRLGGPFLRRYYTTFLDTPYAVATIAETDGRSCGYLVGILDTRAHRKLLLRRHGARLVACALLGFLLHPRLASGLLARRVSLRFQRLRERNETTGPRPAPVKVAVLSHVATVERMRGMRVGSALVADFVETSRASGTDRVSLATLDGPDGAGQFYARQGWRLQARRQTFDGRWIRLYDLELHDGE
ncbi:hypothetical protein JCM10369A_43640 [Nocardioides pyridinolyticus]